MLRSTVSLKSTVYIGFFVQGNLLFTTKHRDNQQSPSVNKITKFITYGGRSFSLFNLPTLDLEYDSGHELELKMARRTEEAFNCPVLNGSNVVKFDADKSSVDKVSQLRIR